MVKSGHCGLNPTLAVGLVADVFAKSRPPHLTFPKIEAGGRGRRGKKRSLQTNRKGISQGHQEHVGWDCAWGQAQGEGLHVGAGEERTAEARGLIEEADYGAGARG